MRHLQQGSEKSFKNFRIALRNNNQGFLVNAMDNAVVSQQQSCSSSENKPVPGKIAAEGGSVEFTEYSTDETKTSSTEIARESTQGISVDFILLLLEFYLNALTKGSRIFLAKISLDLERNVAQEMLLQQCGCYMKEVWSITVKCMYSLSIMKKHLTE